MDSSHESGIKHGPRLWMISVFASSAIALAYLAWIDHKPTGEWRDEFAVKLRVSFLVAIAGLLAISAMWMAFRRVILDSEEISSRGIFGERRMRWDQIQEFYYYVGRLHFFFFPLPIPVAFLKTYSFALVDSQGHKLRFGPGLSRRALLASELIEFSQPHLLQSAIALFNSGADVHFGPVTVNRAQGVRIRQYSREKQFPLSEVYSHGFEEGQFYVWRMGEDKIGILIDKIPNVFVLNELLLLAREGATQISTSG